MDKNTRGQWVTPTLQFKGGVGDILKSGGGKKKKHDKEGPGMPFESVIREDEGGTEKSNPVAKLLSHPKVKEYLADAPKVQQMKRVGQTLVQGTLKDVMKHAQAVLGAKSLQDLQSKLGTKLPGLDKLAQVPEQERAGAEAKLLKGVRDGMKEMYVKQLEAHVKSAVQAGVPQDHPYVSDYQAVISKIKSM